MLRRDLSFAAGLLALALACGAPPAAVLLPPAVTQLSASPSALPYGGGEVTLRWKVEGEGTATLEPGVGEVALQGMATRTLTADTTFTLTARNAAGSASQEVTVTVARTFELRGQVLNASSGLPEAGVKVLVPGATSATTDADGRFTVPGVVGPYAVLLGRVRGAEQTATVYAGLTRQSPTLALFGVSEPTSVATVRGKLTGGTGGPYSGARVFFGGPGVTSGAAEVEPAGGYALAEGGLSDDRARWLRTPEVNGVLLAVQEVSAAGLLTGGYLGELPVALIHGGTFSMKDVALAPATVATVQGEVSYPPGASASGFRVGMLLPSSARYAHPFRAGAAVVGEPVLVTGGGRVTLEAFAQLPDGAVARGSVSAPAAPTVSAQPLQLALVPPPSPISPASGGTVSSGAAFQWSAGGGASLWRLECAGGGVSVHVVTASPSAQLPDVRGVGVALPREVALKWTVVAHGGLESLDAATDGPRLVQATQQSAGHDFLIASSVSRAVTLAP